MLAVLTPRYALSRGSSCNPVVLYAIPYTPPVLPTTSSSLIAAPTGTPAYATLITASPVIESVVSTVIASETILSSPIPTGPTVCVMPPYFTILVNETGHAPQYLYDPDSVNDDALSFTYDLDQSAVFSLTNTNQLEFSVVNAFGTPVVLISEQDVQVCYQLSLAKSLY